VDKSCPNNAMPVPYANCEMWGVGYSKKIHTLLAQQCVAKFAQNLNKLIGCQLYANSASVRQGGIGKWIMGEWARMGHHVGHRLTFKLFSPLCGLRR